MEFSDVITNEDVKPHPIKASAPIASPSGRFLASLVVFPPIITRRARVPRVMLVVRSARSLTVKFTFEVGTEFKGKQIKWSEWSDRVMVFDALEIEIFDLDRLDTANSSTEADLNQGIKPPEGIMKIKQQHWGSNVSIVNVEWISSDQILAFSDYQVAVAIWSLSKKQCSEIYNPKFSSSNGVSKLFFLFIGLLFERVCAN